MRKLVLLAALAPLLCGTQALSQTFSDRVESAAWLPAIWHARLATLAPLCGLRDAAWGSTLASAAKSEALGWLPSHAGPFNSTLPDAASWRTATGALRLAEVAGTRLFQEHPAAACGTFAAPAMLQKADALIADWKAKPETGADGTATFAGPLGDYVWQASALAAAVACKLRDKHFLDDAMSALLAATPEPPADTARDRDKVDIYAATQVAVYAGQREFALIGPALCKTVASDPRLKHADVEVRIWRANPDPWKGFGGNAMKAKPPAPDDE